MRSLSTILGDLGYITQAKPARLGTMQRSAASALHIMQPYSDRFHDAPPLICVTDTTLLRGSGTKECFD